MFSGGYVEIKTREKVSVESFLRQSTAYHELLQIPSTRLSQPNKQIIIALSNPLSFEEIEKVLEKTPKTNDALHDFIKNRALLFFRGYIDDNANFQYYLVKLRDEYESSQQMNEKTKLIA